MRYSRWIFILVFLFPLCSAAQFTYSDISFREAGNLLDYPFTGGFTNAQFNNCDLNRDGRKDVVVFDRDGNVVRCFLWDDTKKKLVYAPQYHDIFPALQNFLIIRDYNNDGIEDLFTYSQVPGIPAVSVFKGSLEGSELSWELVEFSNHLDIIMYRSRSGNFVNAYVSSIDIPAIEDVDKDGDLDLLSFEPGGSYIYFYKNTAVENNHSLDSLNFTLEDNCWGKVYEAETNEALSLSDDPEDCADALHEGEGGAVLRHSGSTLNSLDVNGDELMDLIIGDLSSPNVIALFNGGTQENAWGVRQEAAYPAADLSIDLPVFVATFYADVDGDDIRELIAAPNSSNASRNQSNIWLYDNVDSSGKALTPQFLQEDFILDQTIELSGSSVPAVADVNQDGLPDILVGTYGIQDQTGQVEPRAFLFLNNGTPQQPSYVLADDDYLQLSEYKGNQYFSFAPAFGDLDNDGDIDLMMGNFSGGLFYFENTAGVNRPFEFREEIINYQDIDVGQFSVPQIIDVNGDGLADLLIGERNGNSVNGQACGNINYFENTGSQGNPLFDPEIDNLPNDPCFGEVFTRMPGRFTGYSSPQLIKFDSIYWLISGSESLEVLFYEKYGSPLGTYSLMEENWGQTMEGRRTHPRLFDLNNDGQFEMIIGNNRGGLAIFETPALTNGQFTNAVSAQEWDVEIYPNPVEKYLFVRADEAVDLILYDLSGKELLRREKVRRVEVSHLIPGLYFAKLSSSQGSVVKKWVKH